MSGIIGIDWNSPVTQVGLVAAAGAAVYFLWMKMGSSTIGGQAKAVAKSSMVGMNPNDNTGQLALTSNPLALIDSQKVDSVLAPSSAHNNKLLHNE